MPDGKDEVIIKECEVDCNPLTMNELYSRILYSIKIIYDYLKNKNKLYFELKAEDDSLHISKGEAELFVDYYINNNNSPLNDVNIYGRVHIQLLSYLLDVQIILYDSKYKIINKFNTESKDIIRITTNQIHYNIRNIKKDNTIPIIHNDNWFHQQWTEYNYPGDIPPSEIYGEEYDKNKMKLIIKK